MGNTTEFMRVVAILEEEMTFEKDINVSVFETNIRGMTNRFLNDCWVTISSFKNFKSYLSSIYGNLIYFMPFRPECIPS